MDKHIIIIIIITKYVICGLIYVVYFVKTKNNFSLFKKVKEFDFLFLIVLNK